MRGEENEKQQTRKTGGQSNNIKHKERSSGKGGEEREKGSGREVPRGSMAETSYVFPFSIVSSPAFLASYV